jgi:hypothetical protein
VAQGPTEIEHPPGAARVPFRQAQQQITAASRTAICSSAPLYGFFTLQTPSAQISGVADIQRHYSSGAAVATAAVDGGRRRPSCNSSSRGREASAINIISLKSSI